jgi:hypothetical protein
MGSTSPLRRLAFIGSDEIGISPFRPEPRACVLLALLEVLVGADSHESAASSSLIPRVRLALPGSVLVCQALRRGRWCTGSDVTCATARLVVELVVELGRMALRSPGYSTKCSASVGDELAIGK